MVITMTGASGFIGRKLMQRLPAGANRWIVLGRKDPGLGSGVKFQQWDAMSGAAAIEPCDAVIHLAGEPVAQRWTAEAKRKIRESRVKGTGNLIEGLRRAEVKPRVLVAASAVGIYGNRGDEVLSENVRPASGFLAQTCVEWERAEDAALELGIRVVKVRIGIVLGKEGGALEQMLPPFKFGAGATLGSGKQWMSWIHVDDLVEMIVLALENESVRGAMNGVAPGAVTNKDFTRILASVMRRPALFNAPEFALKLLYGEMAQILLDSQRVVPGVAVQAGFRFRYPELKPALENLLR